MGHNLEVALSSELIASGVALPWAGAGQTQGNRFVMGPAVETALDFSGVKTDPRHALADLWFISEQPSGSMVVQIKSGGRLGKAQRAGEAAGLIELAAGLAFAGMPARAVICAFDAQTDQDAIKAVGEFTGVDTVCGPTLCLDLGLDYDRITERWEACAGDTLENDQVLAQGLYASLVKHYGATQARSIWEQAYQSHPSSKI